MQKPSYTEQAKQYTAKGADILHGQAEYLKGKLVGTQGTGAPAVPPPSLLTSVYLLFVWLIGANAADMHASAMQLAETCSGMFANKCSNKWCHANYLCFFQRGLFVCY